MNEAGRSPFTRDHTTPLREPSAADDGESGRRGETDADEDLDDCGELENDYDGVGDAARASCEHSARRRNPDHLPLPSHI